MPIKIVNEDEIDKSKALLLCNRVIDVPIPNVESSIALCGECNERVWVSHQSPKGVSVFCIQCGHAKMAAEGGPTDFTMTKRQAREFEQHTGKKLKKR